MRKISPWLIVLMLLALTWGSPAASADGAPISTPIPQGLEGLTGPAALVVIALIVTRSGGPRIEIVVKHTIDESTAHEIRRAARILSGNNDRNETPE